MSRWIAFALLLLPQLALAAPKAATSACPRPEGGKPRIVSRAQVQAVARAAASTLKRKSLHVLDLSGEGRSARRALDGALTSGDLCAAYGAAQQVLAAAQAAVVDAALVVDKAERVREWAKANPDAAISAEGIRLVEQALADAKRPARANQKLNRALALVLDSKDSWALPKPVAKAPERESGASSVRFSTTPTDEEVIAGCPVVGKRGSATAQEVADIVARLELAMTQRSLRVTDFTSGPELAAALREHLGAAQSWPAARIACALIARVSRQEITLALVMARFTALNVVRDRVGVTDVMRPRFSELVRLASDEMSAGRHETALQHLEELFIFLGEPARTGDTLGLR